MYALLGASIIWAFSFGLIKTQLAGIDATFVACARLSISLILFLPFVRLGRVPARAQLRLVAIGAVQYGLMYLAYIHAFRWLAGYEVALFTLLTPIYVALAHDLHARRFDALNLGAAAASVAAASIVLAGTGVRMSLWGFLLVQASNVCFAIGQMAYRGVMRTPALREVRDRDIFALLYAGGVAASAIGIVAGDPRTLSAPSGPQWLVLLYLGAIASGLAFFLWNMGVRRTTVGTAAVLNNAKTPLGVAVSLLLFEAAPAPGKLARIAVALVVMAVAVAVTERHGRRRLTR